MDLQYLSQPVVEKISILKELEGLVNNFCDARESGAVSTNDTAPLGAKDLWKDLGIDWKAWGEQAMETTE